MPKFAKKSLSFLLRNDCQRQFRLSLYSDTERKTLPLPPRQTARAGSGQVGGAGDEWQAQQLAGVATIFGAASVVAAPSKPGQVRPEPLFLDQPTKPGEYFFDIQNLLPFQFLVEARLEVAPNFRAYFGLNGLADEWNLPLEWARIQPDIILALPSRNSAPNLYLAADYPREILLNGDTQEIPLSDTRTQLRIIDVKLAADPGAHYFAEVVYYAMTLAAWLKQNGLDHRFVVTSNPAIWPGSYAKSALALRHEASLKGVTVTTPDLISAMSADLETAETSVYVPALRDFFSQRLRKLISEPWDSLDWHPNFRCQNCEFLGYPWPVKGGAAPNVPEHCWIKAKEDDRLSRIAGLSRGAAKVLETVAPTLVSFQSLAAADPVFQKHPTLRAKSAIFRARAQALQTGIASAVTGSGASATIPTFCDLKICIFLDYDAATSLTAAISILADWRESPFQIAPGQMPQSHKRGVGGSCAFVNGTNSVAAEEKQVLAFLEKLREVMDEVRALDDVRYQTALATNPAAKRDDFASTYQIFLWDDAQFRHLKRIIERHFSAIVSNPQLRSLAWLFPPDNVLPHPDLASRQSPISLLSPAIEHHVAAPVPHHYTLFRVARTYLPPSASNPIGLHPLFYEPLTNLVPGERIHEFWNQTGDWMTVGATLRETNYKKTVALSFVLNRLRRDAQSGAISLGESAAPKLMPFKNRGFTNATNESQLWFEFTRLNAALQKVEVEMTYALPPIEREAKFEAAHLVRRLTPQEFPAALNQIGASCHLVFPPNSRRVIYELASTSRDVKFKDGDFTLALSPRDEDLFLHKGLQKRLPLFFAQSGATYSQSIGQANRTRVSLECLDRANGFVVLLLDDDNEISTIEALGEADFSTDVMLDKIPADFLEKKVRLSLEGLGIPRSYATKVPQMASALAPTTTLAVPHVVALTTPTGRARGADKPGHDFLFWPHLTVAQNIGRPVTSLLPQVLALGAPHGIALNASQSVAFEAALSTRLSLIWGPPGTGKSATLRAILLGAILHARQNGDTLRILVSAGTYTAVDNVLLETEKLLRALGISLPAGSAPQAGQVRLFRVQSGASAFDPTLAAHYPHLQNIALEKRSPSADAISLHDALTNPTNGDIVLVGAPNQQVHNLAVANVTGRTTFSEAASQTQKEWFDLIIVDEASQMDVASSSLVFTKATSSGACILAGDHLQLPPIHAAAPPRGMENFIGPIFSYMALHHDLHQLALDDNYRSNQTIVEFVRQTGYSSNLNSYFSDLKLNLTAPIPLTEPENWPAHLPFSPHYAEILNSDKPLLCFVAEDDLSGQSNIFEAQTIASLSWLLWGRIAKAHSVLRHNTQDTIPYGTSDFWEKGIGIVAPHRAQCSLINDSLGLTFLNATPTTGATPQGIRSAVDTVERYQGQERDVIFASFGLGDRDLIALEDEFLYDLNRFNVLVSRAATKAVLFLSRGVVEHLSDDQDVIRASRLLKNFVGLTCGNTMTVDLPFFDAVGALQMRRGELRWA